MRGNGLEIVDAGMVAINGMASADRWGKVRILSRLPRGGGGGRSRAVASRMYPPWAKNSLKGPLDY